MNKDIEKAIKVLENHKMYVSEIIHKNINLAIAVLEKQLNNDWISVSERLPNNIQRVLATLENEMVLEVFYINNKFKFNEMKIGGGMKEVYSDNPVIAWQPLPEPYKEDEKK